MSGRGRGGEGGSSTALIMGGENILALVAGFTVHILCIIMVAKPRFSHMAAEQRGSGARGRRGRFVTAAMTASVTVAIHERCGRNLTCANLQWWCCKPRVLLESPRHFKVMSSRALPPNAYSYPTRTPLRKRRRGMQAVNQHESNCQRRPAASGQSTYPHGYGHSCRQRSQRDQEHHTQQTDRRTERRHFD